MRAVLSAGSNMGDARAHLRSVVDEFAGELVAASSIYATAPWGKTDQPDFLNQSLLVEVDQTPLELLQRCQRLENDAQRVREERWGPRTLDGTLSGSRATPPTTRCSPSRIRALIYDASFSNRGWKLIRMGSCTGRT